jgi:protease-4
MASSSNPNPFWSFIVGVGKFINFANTFVFNVVMVLLLILLLALISLGRTATTSRGLEAMQDKTALVLDLKGTLVEQYTSSPLKRAFAEASNSDADREVQLRDLLRALKLAKTDANIQRVVLLTDGFSVPGFAALREFGAAIRDFETTGKQVVAYGSMMDQKAYYLAAQANEAYLDPEGGIVLEGLGRYRLYYREGLQDKLGVDVHLFRVGEYKSAAEPYILDAASPEAREADLYWMNDLWSRYLDDIASARKLKREDLDALVTTMPERVKAEQGDLAKLALEAKLVDGLKTPDEMEKLLAQRGARDDGKDADPFRQVDLADYLAQHRQVPSLLDDQAKVAVVVAQGEISDGKQPQGTVGGDSTSALIRKAREDDNVKALVLRVDSPGGSVFPSEKIRREIALTKAAGKPVVVSMGNVAASGGYWISMNADKIYADPSTITGSIGIFGLWMSGDRALSKIGVHSDGVGTTPLAGVFDPTRPLDPNAGTMIQSVIDHGYAQFIGKVADARHSQPEKIDTIARGRVWSGAQAKERGLVDVLGGLVQAQDEAAKLARLDPKKYEVEYEETPLSGLEAFFLGMSKRAQLAGLVRTLGPGAALLSDEQLDQVRSELSWMQRPKSGLPVQAVAHCFCGL